MTTTFVTLDDAYAHSQVVKCVVVGDTGVGKTRLICTRACGTKYSLKQLMQTHVPTVWAIDHYRNDKEVYEKSYCTVDNMRVSLQLWDTFGYHDKDRKFAYAKADLILVCFSVVRPRSLRNVVHHWLPEIRQSARGVPIILCGTQIDLRYMYTHPDFTKLDKGPFYREITKDDIVTPETGRNTAMECAFNAYYETSVLIPYGIQDTFENVLRVALTYKREKHFWNALSNSLKRVSKPVIQEPFLPPRPVAPTVEIPPDVWEDDMTHLYDDKMYCDLVFRTKLGQCFEAHKIIVATALPSLHELLNLVRPEKTLRLKGLKKSISESGRNRGKSVKGHETIAETVQLLDTGDDSGISDLSLNVQTAEHTVPSTSKHVVLDHPVFASINQPATDCECDQRTVITLTNDVPPHVFQHVLKFMYLWKCDKSVSSSTNTIIQIQKLAQALDFHPLLDYLTHINYGEEYMNMNLTSTRAKSHQQDLLEQGLQQGLYTDVVFEVEGGCISAHKSLLVTRSDMMACMFSNNFMESSAKVIPFPGVSKHVFWTLLQYLYTGRLSHILNSDLMELMELANRLCLPRLQAVAEKMVISHLTATETAGGEIFEETILLLEPAQLHNACQLASWCIWYLSCNYLQLHKRYGKLKQSLNPDNQVLLSQQRWPPIWYLKEHDYYEKCQLDLEREKVPASFLCHRRSQAANRGCLGFCGCRRRRNHSKADLPTLA